ncbi:NAD(P)-dependent oxidoreductase [Lactobacillus sp. Sy-1]|uniref:NAD(P)-dependent oxidoreductase n=1 Tax=Lactobacillus sp. Sy-1 TaxID=2109645 RepID=UPI001C585194|nr:NAD(P)-dependent oxidoreductase [Lactobacillus sp. Sy-1]MBW1605053.1 hydroxyacid dehydrogenase [Lactobacillus sp. Sy-1]
MNILVAISNENFNNEQIKHIFDTDQALAGNQVYYEFDSPDVDLDQIDVMIGYDQKVLNQILASPTAHLKWIQALSAGVDYYPLKELQAKQILLTTVNGIHAEPIAESTIGMILGQYRFLVESARKQGWIKPTHSLNMIKGKRAAIFGTGHIGSRITELLEAFGAETVGVNHSGHPAAGFKATVSTADLQTPQITGADIIVNALPLTKATTGMFNQAFFEALTNQPIFISIGRGPSTNTDALLAAIDDGKLGAAGLDVTDPEPLPADNPLWHRDNVLITSHISGIHAEYLEEALQILNQNAAQFKQDGTVVINEVNYDKGY